MTLFKEIAASLHHGLDAWPETLAGLRHGGPQEVAHHLHDLDHQGGGSAVRGSVGIPLTYAPDVIIQGIAVRAAGRPKVRKKDENLTISATVLLARSPLVMVARTFSCTFISTDICQLTISHEG